MLICLLAAGMVAGCAVFTTVDPRGRSQREEDSDRATLVERAARLASAATQFQEILEQFDSLADQSGAAWRKRGYLLAAESDQMEMLFLEFINVRDGLGAMVSRGEDRGTSSDIEGEAGKAVDQVLTVDAQFVLMHHTAELVAKFANDRAATAKLNESFYESQIPSGSYHRLFMETTEGDLLKRLEASWTLLKSDLEELEDTTNNNVGSPACRRIIATVPADYQKARAAVARVQGKGIRRAVENAMTHAEAVKIARRLGSGWGNLKYRGRSLLFKTVSRIKNPRAKVIKFSSDQHAQVKSMLQPGDIILTYTAGYMSDVFIPGAFKHGITFVGTAEQRQSAGAGLSKLPALASPESAAVEQGMLESRLANGQTADVIEAVAEGVIFSSLAHIMDTHVNRMAVLRPRLSAEERAEFITEVIAFQGDAYDFLFDFGDASRQVCTEVIYRALDGKGGITFSLTQRGGHPTLSADDLVAYYTESGGRHFDFVLLAEEDFSRPGHNAQVLTGPEGVARLKGVMRRTGLAGE